MQKLHEILVPSTKKKSPSLIHVLTSKSVLRIRYTNSTSILQDFWINKHKNRAGVTDSRYSVGPSATAMRIQRSTQRSAKLFRFIMRKGEGSSTTDHILVMKHCTHNMALDISFAAGAGAHWMPKPCLKNSTLIESF